MELILTAFVFIILFSLVPIFLQDRADNMRFKNYDDPELVVGNTVISNECQNLYKYGVEPICIKITRIDKENDKIEAQSFFNGKQTGNRTYTLEEFRDYMK